ncbi:integrase core domain-containing protein [Variovorax gracilis]|uniref:integrase core domain-containing protein n=1 Tax=Variovorax gracilis TaxID=3053502 RepID=UPI00336C2745
MQFPRATLYDAVAQAKADIACCINFYNTWRPHSSLDRRAPDESCFATLPAMKEAACWIEP